MKFYIFIPIFFVSVLCFARPGDTCDEAITLIPEPSCALQTVDLANRNTSVVVQNHPDAFLGSRFIWYAFTATHEKVSVNFEVNSWFNLALIDDCGGGTTFTALQVYTHFSSSQTEKISFNNLEVGKTYYLLFNTDGINDFVEPTELQFCLSPYKIDVSDCSGALTICSDGNVNFAPQGPGYNDVSDGGCLLGENQSVWYIFGIRDDAPANLSLTFELRPVNEEADYDFAVYGPSASCSGLGAPIRCSFANKECKYCPSTGLSELAADNSEDAYGDGYVAPLIVNPGEVYLLVVDNYDGLGSEFDLDWGGEAANYLNCEVEQVDCLDNLSTFNYKVNNKAIAGNDTTLVGDDILYINTDNQNVFDPNGGLAFAFFDADPSTMSWDLDVLNMYYPDENPNFLGFLPFQTSIFMCNGVLQWGDSTLDGTYWMVPLTVDYIDEQGNIEIDRNTDNCFRAGTPIKITTQKEVLSCGDVLAIQDAYGQCSGEFVYEICPSADTWVDIQVDSFKLEEDSLIFISNGQIVGQLTGNGKAANVQHTTINECVQLRFSNQHSDIKGSYFYAQIDCKDQCPQLPTNININRNEACAFEPFLVETSAFDSLTYLWTVPVGVRIDSGQGTPTIGLTWSDSEGELRLELRSECGVVKEFKFPIDLKAENKPTFDLATTYCKTDSQTLTLPTTSINGISGTWSVPSFEPNTISGSVVSTFTADAFCDSDTTFNFVLEPDPGIKYLDTICNFNPEHLKLILSVDNGRIESNTGLVTKLVNGNFEIDEIPFDTAFEITVISRMGCIYPISIGPIACTPPCDISADIELIHPTCNDSLGYINIGAATGGVEPYYYAVDDGIPSFIQNYRNIQPGTHSVKIRDKYGCQYSEDILIREIVEPVINMPDTIQITTTQLIDLQVNHGKAEEDVISITFEPSLPFGCVNNTCSMVELRAKESFAAMLTFEDKDECIVRDSFYVWVIDKEEILFPNIMERNRGFNGYLAPYGTVEVESISLSVYDRWGGQVAYLPDVKMNRPVTGWNGETATSGKPVPSGTYVYIATVTYHSGYTKVLSGDVLVVGE